LANTYESLITTNIQLSHSRARVISQIRIYAALRSVNKQLLSTQWWTCASAYFCLRTMRLRMIRSNATWETLSTQSFGSL